MEKIYEKMHLTPYRSKDSIYFGVTEGCSFIDYGYVNSKTKKITFKSKEKLIEVIKDSIAYGDIEKFINELTKDTVYEGEED